MVIFFLEDYVSMWQSSCVGLVFTLVFSCLSALMANATAEGPCEKIPESAGSLRAEVAH
jgi:hypothetical protein